MTRTLLKKKATARLVVKGITDPDLVTFRGESPTLSKAARHMILQLGASLKFTFEVGDVKTAFLQGDKVEKRSRCLSRTRCGNQEAIQLDGQPDPQTNWIS